MSRQLKFSEAIREALDLCMSKDSSVQVMGLGVPDPNGVFGTTSGLQEKYGPLRVMDLPTAENGMTGIAIGAALAGQRPILTHHRVEFALLSMEQLVNQAAKWHYVFGRPVPLVVRMLIGRGWGQGPQHSQSLQSMFAHVPGLKVVMPSTPYDAKGLWISAIEDDNPVLILEHRWLYNVFGEVPTGHYTVPLDKGRIARPGSDITIATISHMVLEALQCADLLEKLGVDAEVIDVRCLRPFDSELLVRSVKKTGRFLVADSAWTSFGLCAEALATVSEKAHEHLKVAPRRIGLPDCPTPASPALAKHYYPRARDLALAAANMVGQKHDMSIWDALEPRYVDVPDPTFVGPF